MFNSIQLENLLVIDIETVPAVPKLEFLSPAMQELWHQKEGKNCAEGTSLQDHYFDRAGIFAEFGKIVCISAGYFNFNKDNYRLNFRVKSFYGKDECALLEGFAELLNLYFNKPELHLICGHNIREFDIPYICRRMLINGCLLPRILDISGRKPWEVNFLDTLQLWKFGDFKNYTSLKLLAEIFNIPTPKDDIDGSEVGKVFWEEDNLERIAVYCQKDVLTVAQLVLKFKGMPMLEPEDVFML